MIKQKESGLKERKFVALNRCACQTVELCDLPLKIPLHTDARDEIPKPRLGLIPWVGGYDEKGERLIVKGLTLG
jgi:hypothetical protein